MIGKLGLMAAGGALWKGTSALVGGAVGLGVNPFLGAAVGKGMMGMKRPGGMGAGMRKATGITRDESIVRGMRPHSETRAVAIRPMTKKDDFSTKLQILDKSVRVAYKTSIQNNRELIYIQKMLQGPTAARAKEMRMESARQLAAPSVNNYYMMGGGAGAGGAGGSMLGGLGSLLGMPLALVGLSALMRKFFGEADKGRTTAEEKAGKQRNRFSERLVESIEKLRERMSKNSWRNLKANANRVSSLGRNIIDNLKLFDKANGLRFDNFGKRLGNTLRISFDSWGKNFQNQLRRINLRLQIPYDAGEFSKGAKYIPKDVTRYKPIEAKPWDYRADEFARTKYQPKLDYERYRPYKGLGYDAGEFSKLPYRPGDVTQFKPYRGLGYDAGEFSKLPYRPGDVTQFKPYKGLGYDAGEFADQKYKPRQNYWRAGLPYEAGEFTGLKETYKLPRIRGGLSVVSAGDAGMSDARLSFDVDRGQMRLPSPKTIPGGGAEAARISGIGTTTPGEYSRSLTYTGPRETKGYVKPYISAGQRRLPPPKTIVGEGAAAARISRIGTTPPGIPYRGAAGSFGAERGGKGGAYETPTNRQALKLFSKILGESVETMEAATRRIPAFIKTMGESLGDWFAKQNARLERWYTSGLAGQVIMRLLAIWIIGTALREAWKTVWKEPDANGNPRTWKGYGQWLKAYGKDLGIGIALWIAISKFVDVLIGIFFVSGIGWPAAAALFVAKTLLVIWLHHWISSKGKGVPADMEGQWQRKIKNIIDASVLQRMAGDFGMAGGIDRPMQIIGGAGSSAAFLSGVRERPSVPVTSTAVTPTIITPSAQGTQQAGSVFNFNFAGAKDWVTGWFKGSDPKKDPTTIKWTGPTLKATAINPEKLYKALRNHVDHVHAMGILINIGAESSYRPEAYNPSDAGGPPSGGLCQWHGSRLTKMEAAVPNWRNNWQGQIKYIFTEDWRGRATQYKSLDFKRLINIPKIGDVSNYSPEERAAMWWHYYWEVAGSSRNEAGREKRIKRLKNYQMTAAHPAATTPASDIIGPRLRGYNPASNIDRGAGHWEYQSQGPRKPALRTWVPDNTQSYWDSGGGSGVTNIFKFDEQTVRQGDSTNVAYNITMDPFVDQMANLSGPGDLSTSNA